MTDKRSYTTAVLKPNVRFSKKELRIYLVNVDSAGFFYREDSPGQSGVLPTAESGPTVPARHLSDLPKDSHDHAAW